MKFPRQHEPHNSTPDDDAPTGAGVPTASDSLAPAGSDSSPHRPGAAPSDVGHDTSIDSGPGEGAPTTGADPAPASASQAGLTGKGRVRRTRVSALWIGVVVAAVLAIFLLIFIAQNSDAVTIAFLGWEGQISLAVAMLLAAVVAVLIVAVPGSLRIGQLRRALRKNAHH